MTSFSVDWEVQRGAARANLDIVGDEHGLMLQVYDQTDTWNLKFVQIAFDEQGRLLLFVHDTAEYAKTDQVLAVTLLTEHSTTPPGEVAG